MQAEICLTVREILKSWDFNLIIYMKIDLGEPESASPRVTMSDRLENPGQGGDCQCTYRNDSVGQ